MAEAVSALICVRDCERYLRGAIESALEQTLAPAEVVVVDDGSRDGSAALAESLGAPVRCIRQPALGLGHARNAALETAGGDYVAYLDADDLWPATRLADQLAAFAGSPAPDLVFGHLRQFAGAAPIASTQVAPGIFGGTLVCRREDALRVGPFRTDIRAGEFMDWILRARDLGLRETTVPEVVLLRRVHDANMTAAEHEPFRDYARLLKDSLDRRRAAG